MGRVEAYSDRFPDIPHIRAASALVAALGSAVRIPVFSLTLAPLKSVTAGGGGDAGREDKRRSDGQEFIRKVCPFSGPAPEAADGTSVTRGVAVRVTGPDPEPC
jgi:hypothetical protein